MNIRSTVRSSKPPESRPASPPKPEYPPDTAVETLADFVAVKPLLALSEVLDVAVAVPVAFDQELGGGPAMRLIAGAGAAARFLQAAHFGDRQMAGPSPDEARKNSLTIVSAGLTATGHLMAATGAGPLSLAPLAVGKFVGIVNGLPKRSLEVGPREGPISAPQRFANYLSDEPVSAIGHTLDLAVGVPLAFGMDFGGGDSMALMGGAGAFVNFFAGLFKLESLNRVSDESEQRSLKLQATGHMLSAAGLTMSAMGMGPFSLAPLALGKAVTLLDGVSETTVYRATKSVAETPGEVTRELFREEPSLMKQRAAGSQ